MVAPVALGRGHVAGDQPSERRQLGMGVFTRLTSSAASSRPWRGRGTPGRQREILWLLWRWEGDMWREISRASAVNWEWALVLKPVAERLLYPEPGLVDVLARGREVAANCCNYLYKQIEREAAAVRKHVWTSLYDQAAGRIASE